MSRQTTILVIVFIILSFVVGLGAGLKIGRDARSRVSTNVPGENTYQAGWNAAKKRLADSGFYPMAPAGMEIRNISGEIKEASENKITLKTRPLEPLADPSLDTRIVIVDNNTKIYQMEQRDMAVVQKEMEEFQKMMQERIKDPANAKLATPPETFIKKEIKISDLKAGQQISIISATNIKDAKEIKATEIMAQVMPAVGEATSNIPDTTLPPMPPAPVN